MKIKLFFIILFFSQSVFGGTGLATVYKITMTKIELCENATIINETSYTTSGCITVGTGNLTVDIASAAAGADIAKFADTTGLPIGKSKDKFPPVLADEQSALKHKTVSPEFCDGVYIVTSDGVPSIVPAIIV